MWLLELQTAEWLWVYPGAERIGAATAVATLYLLLVIALRYQQQRRQKVFLQPADSASTHPPLLVAFASQTGSAEQIAWQTAKALDLAGVPTTVEPLGNIHPERLTAATRVLFVVSTTGEGDAPDNAVGFTRAMVSARQTLPALQYGVLSLGDREYRNFCGFGRQLEGWLRECGAQPLFDAIEVDNGDEQALQRWRRHLGTFTPNAPEVQWQEREFGLWRLKDRRVANPNSAGLATYHLTLEALGSATPMWEPGDIAEIRPHHPIERVVQFLENARLDGREVVRVAGRALTLAEVLSRSVLPDNVAERTPQQLADHLVSLPQREFSIASTPEEGYVQLLIRQSRDRDGRLGLASGWLTQYAWLDARIEMRIRTNKRMHPPAPEVPLILICNGTGIAGLRPHLKARATHASATMNWLIFGERNAAHDFYYREDLETWLAQGLLTRADWAFSRDQPQKLYVQDKILAAAPLLKRWVDEGAHIFVCGSLEGMAAGVDAALKQVLGPEVVAALIQSGRYRKDVY